MVLFTRYVAPVGKHWHVVYTSKGNGKSYCPGCVLTTIKPLESIGQVLNTEQGGAKDIDGYVCYQCHKKFGV